MPLANGCFDRWRRWSRRGSLVTRSQEFGNEDLPDCSALLQCSHARGSRVYHNLYRKDGLSRRRTCRASPWSRRGRAGNCSRTGGDSSWSGCRAPRRRRGPSLYERRHDGAHRHRRRSGLQPAHRQRCGLPHECERRDEHANGARRRGGDQERNGGRARSWRQDLRQRQRRGEVQLSVSVPLEIVGRVVRCSPPPAAPFLTSLPES
jgi:hypothetical protein